MLVQHLQHHESAVATSHKSHCNIMNSQLQHREFVVATSHKSQLQRHKITFETSQKHVATSKSRLKIPNHGCNTTKSRLQHGKIMFAISPPSPSLAGRDEDGGREEEAPAGGGGGA